MRIAGLRGRGCVVQGHRGVTENEDSGIMGTRMCGLGTIGGTADEEGENFTLAKG